MNSVTARYPLQNTLESVFLRFCLSVSALAPIASHPKFVLRGISFFGMGDWFKKLIGALHEGMRLCHPEEMSGY